MALIIMHSPSERFDKIDGGCVNQPNESKAQLVDLHMSDENITLSQHTQLLLLLLFSVGSTGENAKHINETHTYTINKTLCGVLMN